MAIMLILVSVLLAVTLLWLTGRKPLGGPYDVQVLGSIGEWGAGIVTGTAVGLRPGNSPRPSVSCAAPSTAPKR